MNGKLLSRCSCVGLAGGLLAAVVLALFSAGNSVPADEKGAASSLPADLARIPSDAAFLASARVADLLSGEVNRSVRQKFGKMVDEGMQEFQKEFGFALDQVERMTVVIMDPPPGREQPLLFVRITKPYDRDTVLAPKKAKEQSYKGQTLFVGDRDWAIYPLDRQSLVFGRRDSVQMLIDHPAPKTEGNLATARGLAAGTHSAVLALNVRAFNDAIGERLPGEMEPFKPLFQALYGTIVMDLGRATRTDVKLAFASEKEAAAALKPASTGLDLARMGLERGMAELKKQKEMSQFVELLKEVQDSLKGTKVTQEGTTLEASARLQLDVAKLGEILVPVIQKTRDAAARSQSTNNLKQIALAMHNFHDVNRAFPAQASYDKNGKPMLSWRVMILPYLDEKALYDRFKFDEPWDSEHNKKLLAMMPKVYASPQDEKTLKDHTTHYQGFVGKGAFFDGKQGIRVQDIPDGTSNTFMIVESSKAVPWTKPEDLPYDAAKPLPRLGLPGANGFVAAICDGSVRFISNKVSEKTLRLVIERNDGNPIPNDF